MYLKTTQILEITTLLLWKCVRFNNIQNFKFYRPAKWSKAYGTLNRRSDEDENNVHLPFATEQLEALATFVQVFEHRDVLNCDFMRWIIFCQRVLMSERAFNMAQGNILPFFLFKTEMLTCISIFFIWANESYLLWARLHRGYTVFALMLTSVIPWFKIVLQQGSKVWPYPIKWPVCLI